MESQEPLRVFLDADVLFAGAASPSDKSASQVTLQLAEITLIDALTSRQGATEAERNLRKKIPRAVETFQLILSRTVEVVDDPTPAEVRKHKGKAEQTDLPLLVTALREACPYLVTYNLSDYEPGHPDLDVLTPGAFVRRVRDRLSRL